VTSVNTVIKIIQSSQSIPINASITNIKVKTRGSYREQPIKEYTTCENVMFYPVEIIREEKL
jgi:hypothetical protein